MRYCRKRTRSHLRNNPPFYSNIEVVWYTEVSLCLPQSDHYNQLSLFADLFVHSCIISLALFVIIKFEMMIMFVLVQFCIIHCRYNVTEVRLSLRLSVDPSIQKSTFWYCFDRIWTWIGISIIEFENCDQMNVHIGQLIYVGMLPVIPMLFWMKYWKLCLCPMYSRALYDSWHTA